MTRAAVCLISWWACGVSQAVEFPSQPLQTGVVQPAPNVVFILDDSLSMTSTSGGLNGAVLDTGLTWTNTAPGLGSGQGAPYTKNPLSYNPNVDYEPWATANDTDTAVERLDDADYNDACGDFARLTGCDDNLSGSNQTFYVPKSTATQADQTEYYRYQIRSGGNILVRAEWVNTNNVLGAVTNQWTGQGANANSWSNGGGTNITSSSVTQYFDVLANDTVSSLVITTSGTLGTNRNPNIYVKRGNVSGTPVVNPCRTSTCTIGWSAAANGANQHESLTISNPVAGRYYIGIWNSGSANISTSPGMTVTVTATMINPETALGCTVHATNYGWKNCTNISVGGDANTKNRGLDAEKQNYANWYQYHRTRMKVAKAGGSEAFSRLDENYRVGLMGLYPTGTNKQVFGGSATELIPVANNGGLFKGDNRKDWFDYLHNMVGKSSTPLRQALNAAGKYYTTDHAYESTADGKTTYLACRQNFTILTTDGYWNNYSGDDPDSNYTGDKIKGDEEDGVLITGPNNQEYTYKARAPFWYDGRGDYADKTTLADIAMHYWKTDLRTTDVPGYPRSAENRVPTSTTGNPAFWQHMVTFGVGLGVRGFLTDAEVNDAMSGNADKGYWPAPVHATDVNDHPENVDDLRHAALNSYGSYINANDAAEFAGGISDALRRIGERRGSASNVLANSTSISNDSFVFQAIYTAGSWRGDLIAYPVSDAGLGKAKWFAADAIPAAIDRDIFTANDAGAKGSAFPNSSQKADLTTAASKLALGVNGDDLAAYLRGDSTNEIREAGTGVLRARHNLVDKKEIPKLMGDIVDSSPFYVADTKTVFVGANDGMLHAIDGSTNGGAERFTYIPRGVDMSLLAELADPKYGTHPTNNPHRFFVDGPITVSSQARTPGRNYLVGAMGRGGRGVYGLDVTTPTDFSEDSVLWDNTGDSAPDNMGNVISEPLISKLNNDVTAAIVANGPNSKTGTASLFIINLDSGDTITEFDTDTDDNGLSAPRAVDVNADGKVDYFFAGDLLGNMWRFDVSDPDTAKWGYNKVFTGTKPISSAPGVARDSANDIWVFFGTGRYMTTDDQKNTDTQSYYGINVGDKAAENSDLTRSSLQERSIQVVDSMTGRRAFEPAATGVDAGKFGWFIDLNKPAGMGERVISAPLIYDNILVFSSIVPPNDSTLNSCDAGGTGYVNALDAFSGTSLAVPFFDVIDPTIKDGDDDLPIGSLPIGAGMPTAPIIIGNQLVVGDSSGGTPTSMEVNAPGGSSKRRLSWRELVNK